MNLIKVLDEYSSGPVSEEELKFLFDITLDIAVRHLKFVLNYSQGSGRILSREEIRERAISCVSELFLSKGEKNSPLLSRIWKSAITKSEGDKRKALEVLTKTVRIVVFQQHTQQLREKDPEQWKLIRTTRYAIHQHPKLSLIRDKKKSLVTETKLKRHLRTVPKPILENYSFSTYTANDKISDFVSKSSRILGFNGYNSIDFWQLVTTIKNYLVNISQDNQQESADFLMQKEYVHHLLPGAMRYIASVLKDRYVTPKKISQKTADQYIKSVYHYFFDLLMYGESKPQFKYYQRYCEESDAKSFRQESRNLFTYLVRLTRQWISDMLQRLSRNSKFA